MVEGGAPVFRLCALKRFRRGAAAIGNADIYATEAGLDGSDKGSNCFRISHIQRLMENLVARRFLNVCSSLGQGACSACADGQVRSFAGQFFRRRAAKSFAGRRDDGYAACEP